MSNKDIVKEHMEEAMTMMGERTAKETAEQVREQYIKNLNQNIQGEDGLVKYVSEVKQARNDSGQFTSQFEFDVDHPTAKLHERGGPIEPTYGRAKADGWTRDGFYDALKDCEYEVRKKNHLRNAVNQTVRDMD